MLETRTDIKRQRRIGKCVLLTGFGPFPGVPVNATMTLVPRLVTLARRQFPDVEFICEILPTEWRAAPLRMERLLCAHSPDVVLHFGVSRRARGFEIERRGRNLRAAQLDAAGRLPETACVCEEAHEVRPARLPVAEIVRRLRRLSIPAYESWSAGKYLCNATLYHSLAAPGRAAVTGFIHIPDSLAASDGVASPQVPRASPGCPITWPQAVAGGLNIVAACLARPPRHPTMISDAVRWV